MNGRTGKKILVAALLWALVLPAGAELVTNSDTDTTYSGALDTRTGQPVTSQSQEGGSEGETVKLLGAGDYGFDQERQMYVSYVGRIAFYSSVPPGIVLSKGQSVSFQLPSGVTGTLYKNGDVVESAGLTGIGDTGSYILQVQGSGPYDTASFQFTILGEITGNLVDYTLPEVDQGEAHGAVTLADLEPGAWIQVEHNGETSRIVSPKTVLSEAGRYVLTVYDQAGNSNQYVFTIHVYLNLSAVMAISLAAAGCALVVFYSRWVRRHARVG